MAKHTMEPGEVRRIRKALKLTQAEMAERLQVSVYTVRAWEWGRRTCRGPAKVMLEKWQRELGKIAEILNGIDH